MEELVRRLEALEQRCDRQEAELRRLAGQQGSPVQAPFRVVDDEGRVLMEVGQSQAGVRLRLFDASGAFLISLQGTAHGGDLVIHGADGRVAAALGAGTRGGILGIHDHQGNLVAWLNATETGGHVVARSTEAGEVRTREMAAEAGDSTGGGA